MLDIKVVIDNSFRRIPESIFPRIAVIYPSSSKGYIRESGGEGRHVRDLILKSARGVFAL